MNTRPALLVATAIFFSTALPATGAAQRGGQVSNRSPQTPQRSSQGARKAVRTAQPRPRANQGHIPKTPPPRTNPVEQRQAEHLPTGHVNDVPHVNHDQWFGHEPPNDPGLHMDHPFSHGHFAHAGSKYRYRVNRVDPGLHRFWFPGGFYFEVAASDWPLCADWCWDCGEDFTVYEDPDHPGWYLLYDVETGAYVHAQYMGS